MSAKHKQCEVELGEYAEPIDRLRQSLWSVADDLRTVGVGVIRSTEGDEDDTAGEDHN